MFEIILFTGFWVDCNDEKLKKCTLEDVMTSQAYILFYTKRKLV